MLSLSRYNLTTECLLNWELNAKAGLEMVGRAGFKSFGFTLRAEPATSLSRYGLTIEYLLNWELNAKAGLEMVGRAGFKSFGFTLRAEPATSLSRYDLATECLLGLILRWWVVQDSNLRPID
ncbi:hypothetical protein ABN309_10400 [Providencia rettgeri]|uniref:hypothetical protein n=1 Tax=Providencia rettgeri TaxID=587 RepID=UPI0032DB414E